MHTIDHEEHEDMQNFVGGAHSNAHSCPPLSHQAHSAQLQGNINVEAVSPLICFVETDAQEERNDAGPDLWFI